MNEKPRHAGRSRASTSIRLGSTKDREATTRAHHRQPFYVRVGRRYVYISGNLAGRLSRTTDAPR